MILRFVTNGFVAFFAVIGLALAIVGIGIFRQHAVSGLSAFLVGGALAAYAVRLALNARRDRFPDWIRDVLHSAPL